MRYSISEQLFPLNSFIISSAGHNEALHCLLPMRAPWWPSMEACHWSKGVSTSGRFMCQLKGKPFCELCPADLELGRGGAAIPVG